jgi:predicted RNA-binding protein associated with RNAse of E/G family
MPTLERFSRETMDLVTLYWNIPDRFIEHFFADRWYNILEVHSVHDDHQGLVLQYRATGDLQRRNDRAVDLALDVWINPDGSYHVLDQDEFEALDLDRITRLRARQAVGELIYLLYHRAAPFTAVDQPRAL